MTRLEGLFAVVPAGGAGTRLWPLSRRNTPKFLLDLTGDGRSLLQHTWDRLVPLVGADSVLVVTGRAHAAAVRHQLPDLAERDLLLEPSRQDSMPAIGLAAAVLALRRPDAVLGSFAADHVVRNEAAFHDAVRQAVAVAARGRIVTIGIEPSYAATGYGYIRTGDSLGLAEAPDARHVESFVEKPDAETAGEYIAAGCYRWNAGMFVTRVDVLLDQLGRHQPLLRDGLAEIAGAWDGPQRTAVLDRVWPTLPRISIDHAVAEPAAADGAVAVVPADLGWDDVGDFAAVARLLPGDGTAGLAALGDAGDLLAVDSTGIVVPGNGRLVAVAGLADVVVVDTPDALLVTTRARAQEVKALVDRLLADGRDDLL